MLFLTYVVLICDNAWRLCAGALHGAFHIAKDSCLYVEHFITQTVASDTHNSSRAMLGLNYYFGHTGIAHDDVPLQVYGINTTELTAAVSTPAAQVLLGYLNTTTGQAAVNSLTVINATQKQQILSLPTNLAQLNSSIMALTDAVQVGAIAPIYHDAKDLVCCQGADVLHRLWIAWLVTAVVAVVLAIFLTAQVMSFVGPVPGMLMTVVHLLHVCCQ